MRFSNKIESSQALERYSDRHDKWQLLAKSVHNFPNGNHRSLPRDLFKRWRFWNLPYPYGCADIAAEDMIDLDEAGIKATHVNRKIRNGVKGVRVREDGPYGHDSKLTMLMAATGRPGPNDRFVRLEERPGTDVIFLYNFVDSIIESIGLGT